MGRIDVNGMRVPADPRIRFEYNHIMLGRKPLSGQ
jgi:hypothetical protein